MMPKLVPKLRFKEFSGEWDEKKIEDIFNSYSGGTPSSTTKDYYGGSIPFIRSAEINAVKTELFLTEKGYKNSSAKYVNKGDILFALYGANSGDVAISKIQGAINQAVLCLSSEKENHHFLYFYLSKEKNNIINKYIQGGQGNLSGEIIKSLIIRIPSIEEQQKIADTLSSLDALIEAQTKKIEALKKHKKGLMQQLFPQEGEKTPKLRFKEFSGEWEEKSLGKVSHITTGSSNREDSTENDGEYTFFDRSEDIRTSTRYLFDDEAIIIAGEGQKFTPKYYKGKFDLHQRTYAILELQVVGEFLYYFIDRHKEYFLQNAVGSTVKSLRLPMFQKMPIFLPTLPEQQKIADTLSSLDALLEAQTKKVEALKKHKKGLMQQMFVNGEEK